ncbi:hypothetical protein LNTAR_20713 [Lentisphaera araneosa HTCC2155]|uniref:Uncharacterized protein n=1 Tax=Lentisphaera araneosa HTCC2155 TaxID=313628 RepID=A6DL65_9BACT|nr:hypothetical protein [Lentisphaera araneosa]EDM27667.1 hypothetical protein LNTAR_20713 [Lentisphaera araneosa HTCC2155]
MLFTHKDKIEVKLFDANDYQAENNCPILHISLRDGLNPDEMKNTLEQILHSKTEWYVAYGPDALFWAQQAEMIKIAKIAEEVDSLYNFSSLSYEEDEPINQAIHKLLGLSSLLNDNQVYESFTIVSDSFEETKRCLEAFGLSPQD